MAKQTTEDRKKKDRIYNILMAVFVAVFLFAGVRLALIYINYQKAVNEYSSLEKDYIQEAAVQESTTAGTEVSAASAVAAAPAPLYPHWTIDFAALRKVNEDIDGWLYMEACSISYPIVRGSDNEYYLKHTFEKKTNSSGAVFMDYRNNLDYSDLNTFVYGHNMKNGSMFGKLKKLYKETGLRSKYPYFYIFNADGQVLKYQIFSYYITTDDSDSYTMIDQDKNYDAYVSKVTRRSIEKIEADTSGHEPIVTLSTCSGPSGGNQRFLVHGILVGKYDLSDASETNLLEESTAADTTATESATE